MFMKKSLFLFLGALAVGGAQGIVTNYWAGSSGGNGCIGGCRGVERGDE